MADMQTVWENGGQDAYFASVADIGGGYGAANRGSVNVANIGFDPAVGAKTRQNVLVRGANGNSFYRNMEINAQRAYNAVRGAANKGAGMAVGAAEKTAGYAARGVESAGRGAVNTGGFMRDRANQLGGVMRTHPRAAGAVILGGTVLGGGGAYAMSRRGDN